VYGTYSENALDRVRHGRDRDAVKTHCPHGHPYDAENTFRNNLGSRCCRTCIRIRSAKNNARRRAA